MTSYSADIKKNNNNGVSGTIFDNNNINIVKYSTIVQTIESCVANICKEFFSSHVYVLGDILYFNIFDQNGTLYTYFDISK